MHMVTTDGCPMSTFICLGRTKNTLLVEVVAIYSNHRFSDSGCSKGTQTRGIVEFGPLRMTEGGEAKKGSEYLCEKNTPNPSIKAALCCITCRNR